MTKLFSMLVTLTAILLLGLCLSACGASTETTWSSESVSPDGNWTATAMTEGTSGPGNNYLGTSVFLKRATSQGRGYEVLGYPEDTSTWARGKAVLTLHWRDNSTLEIVFHRKPKVDLQVCKYGDIDISIREVP